MSPKEGSGDFFFLSFFPPLSHSLFKNILILFTDVLFRLILISKSLLSNDFLFIFFFILFYFIISSLRIPSDKKKMEQGSILFF